MKIAVSRKYYKHAGVPINVRYKKSQKIIKKESLHDEKGLVTKKK